MDFSYQKTDFYESLVCFLGKTTKKPPKKMYAEGVKKPPIAYGSKKRKIKKKNQWEYPIKH